MNQDVIQSYLSSPFLEEALREELTPLVDAAARGEPEARAELSDRFAGPLAFGTGGLRGKMAAGLNRMNKPNIRRVTTALARIAEKYAPEKKVALVGYDTRLQSDCFALETARVLAARGYVVHLGRRPLPTPFLCYAMGALQTACGVIVTASHNPKIYNGYKAYNHLGGQVVAPMDAEIEVAMQQLPMVMPPTSDEFDERILPIPEALEESFLALSLEALAHPRPFTPAKILFTPFHGTGGALIPELFRRAGFPLTLCERQSVQDGHFPTAPRPNPEELAAFATPLEDAVRLGCEVILATDPDADRLGVLYQHAGQWHLLSGNDMAALFLDYLATHCRRQGTVITTVVTSDFLAAVAERHAMPVVWTLTGFKNVAACMHDLAQHGETFAFAAEESIGVAMRGDIRDKDAVSAALVFAEMLGFLKAKGQTLHDAISELQTRVGVFHNRLVNLEDPSFDGMKRFAEAMRRLRASAIDRFAGQAVAAREDYLEGVQTAGEATRPLLDRPDRPALAKPIQRTNLLKLRLQDGSFAAFRPSGTEPKLKIYLQSTSTPEYLERMESEARKLLGFA